VALVATSDGHVGVWNLATQSLLRAYRGYSTWVVTARFDASGRWNAIAELYGRVCLHRVDVDGCYAALVGHGPEPIAHVSFLGDRQIITASEDGTVRQWNPPYEDSSSELACELQGHLFDPEHGGVNVTTRECAAGVTVRPHPAP
jgi:WD40 repeat protein